MIGLLKPQGGPSMNIRFNRRALLKAGAATSLSLAMPAISRAQSRPVFTHGLQSGDVDVSSGMVWARADRPSKVLFEYATTESFADTVRLPPLHALPESDFAVKRLLAGLPSDQHIFWRAQLADLSDVNAMSEPFVGHFRTAPATRRSVSFAWSGDTAGQGWGINADDGGMKTYATMVKHAPEFFIHSGDTIYADGPIGAEKDMPGGGKWKNLVAEGVEKVAETLDEFRGRWKYNMLDDNVRAFNAQVPTFFQWDDHEVVNNWSDAKSLMGDDRYTEKSVPLLTARAARAFHEMTPIRYTPEEPGRVYRKIAYGPLLDIFFVDLRSYRGPNGPSTETELTPASRILGETQLNWLKSELAASKATWKVIASDMPIGVIVWDNFKERAGAEAIANGEDGPASGRELEIADLLRFIKTGNIGNVVWLTADVHYTSAHYYDPNKAKFQDFEPFWEFVSGPLHAGSFGPNDMDATFGPDVRFYAGPQPGQEQNLPPSMGLQFFGLVDIDGGTERMTVRLMNRDDQELYKITLDPVRKA
jgi:alkaline phosphatase D